MARAKLNHIFKVVLTVEKLTDQFGVGSFLFVGSIPFNPSGPSVELLKGKLKNRDGVGFRGKMCTKT